MCVDSYLVVQRSSVYQGQVVSAHHGGNACAAVCKASAQAFYLEYELLLAPYWLASATEDG